jgi:hypothetical protein
MSESREAVVGGLYASRGEDGLYRILKVLVVDEFAIHVRLYVDRFAELPQQVHSANLSLTMTGLGPPTALGIGHFPVAHEGFWSSDPVLVGQESVADSELDGYRIWAGIDSIE